MKMTISQHYDRTPKVGEYRALLESEIIPDDATIRMTGDAQREGNGATIYVEWNV